MCITYRTLYIYTPYLKIILCTSSSNMTFAAASAAENLSDVFCCEIRPVFFLLRAQVCQLSFRLIFGLGGSNFEPQHVEEMGWMVDDERGKEDEAI